MLITKQIFLLTVLVLGGFSTQAQNWYPSQALTQSASIQSQPLSCPTVGSDYSQMISHLHSLQDKISGDANCGQLIKNLESIGQLSDERRRKFLQTVEKINNGEAIDDKTMQSLVKYAEDVTVAVGSLATLLSESGQCFGKQDVSDSLFALSAFVNEASALVSTVAGPWGPAIAIGGKVVAGFLTGVNKFIASIPGYDFNNKKDWQGYVETLCTFHEQQDEIHALIHPEEVVQGLENVQTVLNRKLNSFIGSSKFGPQLVAAFQSKNEGQVSDMVEAMNAEAGGAIGLNAVRLLTARSWIEQRINNVIREANDPLAPGQYLVQKQRDEIEEFLIARQGPKFLSFQVNEADRAVRAMEQFIIYDGHALYNQISYLDKVPQLSPLSIYPDQMEIIKVLLSYDETKLYGKGLQADQAYSTLVYFKRELRKRWDAINVSYGVKSSFCAFFERAGYYSLAINDACTSRKAQAVERTLSTYKAAGMSLAPPMYLRKLGNAKGLDWSDALESWAKQL